MSKTKTVQTYVVIWHKYRAVWIEVWQGSDLVTIRKELRKLYPGARFAFGVPHPV